MTDTLDSTAVSPATSGDGTAETPHHLGGKGLDAQDLKFMLEALGDFTEGALPDDRMLDLDHEDVCPEDTVREMCDPEVLGVQAVFIPEEYGGMGGGAFDSYRVCERMGRVDIGLATAVFATFLGSDPILMGGTEEQRKQWLGRIAEEGLLFAYGATEPEAGSDLGAMTTTAQPVPEDEGGGYRITGRKQWISNGTIADAYTILAMAPGGPTWFVVEKGAQGFASAPPEDKHGIRLSNTAALFLDDVHVPAENVVGGAEGRGLVQAQQVFGYTRLMVAAFGLGGGWEATDRAIRYSTQRVQGGAPLSEKQGYTHKLIIPHVVRLEAARAFVEETASRIDAGEGDNGALNTEGAIAKYLATEAGIAAADAAIQAHGGYGYTRPYIVEKIRRDVRITTIYEGTSEIMEMTISRDRWQQHLKTRGAYYRDAAARVRTLHTQHPDVGAETAALGFECLAAVLEACRAGRLTRNQHVLLRLGEIIAHAEGAGALVRRAVAAADGSIAEKADRRFDAKGLATLSRIYAREAAMKVAEEGGHWVFGAAEPGTSAQLAASLPLDQVRAAQAGLVADMDALAAVLYSR